MARLTVIGSRAVERLVALAGSSAAPHARAAALRTLEAIGAPRALAPALDILADAGAEPAVGAARQASPAYSCAASGAPPPSID